MRMVRRKTYTSEPKTPLNQWVRDALAYMAETTGVEPTYDDVATALNRARLGSSYDKSTVQKMTTIRGVKLPEAVALSQFTGFPLPLENATEENINERINQLSDHRRMMVLQYLADQEALHRREASDQEKEAPEYGG